MRYYYYYLYFRIYKFISKLGKLELFYMTSYNVSLLEMYLLMSITLFLIDSGLLPKEVITPLLFVFFTIMWFYNNYIFLHKKKYEEILKMFENETKRQKRISFFIVLGIYLFTTFLFISGLIISSQK
jgi:hypothetical protein